MMPIELTFMQKLRQIIRIRNLIIFCLLSLLIWWGGKAILKYWRQPLTTDTSVVFGDNENGIQFPFITIYDEDFFTKHPLLKNCYSTWDLIGSFISCIKENKNFRMESFMDNLQLDIRKIVARVVLWTGRENIILDNLNGKSWSKTFHYAFGLSHTFDLSKIDKFQYVSYQEIMRPGLSLVMAENNPWQRISIMLHTKNDLPDAFVLNGAHMFTFSNTTNQRHKFDVKKKVNRRESTRKVPCVQYEYNTCQNIEDNQLILDQFHCRIPILYSGQHLDELIPKDVLNCSLDEIKEGLDLILKKESNCKKIQTCEMTRFTSTYTVQEKQTEQKISVAFINPEVEYYHTYVSYDLQSLVGEIGGIIGITLGASTLTLLESLLQHLRYY